ncbi:hypothetical protein MJO28_010340 [Puccinia striiformis f. sp. tritici]|uniref:Uncharacterized protein n=1 Tax=Puccinia striiformis f. sp. tritici TaxID=168172 RepID=A0ACC0E4P9_9BASI|nr:hypothetical protein MJO28_010340 [Puccinia striiformis f. sp. tritici]
MSQSSFQLATGMEKHYFGRHSVNMRTRAPPQGQASRSQCLPPIDIQSRDLEEIGNQTKIWGLRLAAHRLGPFAENWQPEAFEEFSKAIQDNEVPQDYVWLEV